MKRGTMNKLTEEEAHTALTSILTMTDSINQFSISTHDDLGKLKETIESIEGELEKTKVGNSMSLSGESENHQVFYDLHYAIKNYEYASEQKIKTGAYKLM